jgi:hypothetical protein
MEQEGLTNITMSDKKSIIAFLKLVHARTKAGEDICLKCYVKKVLEILDKYDGKVQTNSKKAI